MRIQWQVVGIQIDVVCQQSLQALFHPTHHTAILPAPKQTVVHQHSVGLGMNGGIDQLAAGRDARHHFVNLTATFHLQAIGSIVFKSFRLQQLVKRLKQRLGICHGNLI